MNPFVLQRIAIGVILWACAVRLQQAVALMGRGMSFTQAFAVETFGPILLVGVLLWRAGVLFRRWENPVAGLGGLVGLGLMGIAALKPMLYTLLVALPGSLAGPA
jgi:hypothetical protein